MLIIINHHQRAIDSLSYQIRCISLARYSVNQALKAEAGKQVLKEHQSPPVTAKYLF